MSIKLSVVLLLSLSPSAWSAAPAADAEQNKTLLFRDFPPCPHVARPGAQRGAG